MRTRGAAWLRHCKLLFIKQVLPRFPRPDRPFKRPLSCSQMVAPLDTQVSVTTHTCRDRCALLPDMFLRAPQQYIQDIGTVHGVHE